MDVLRPVLVWIDGRCYRKLDVETQQTRLPYEDDVHDYTSCATDEICDANIDIEELKNGQFKHVVDVPNAYVGTLIGSKGATKKRLETETHTRILFPKLGVEGGIVITGQSKKDVISARTRMDVIIDGARQKHPFTHFLSVPLTHPDIMDRFLDFQHDVLRKCDRETVRGLDPSIFQKAHKLHLTIGTMPLLNNEERQKAVYLLSECNADIVRPILKDEPLKIQLKGVECMNDDPAEVDVLYAKVESLDGLNTLQVIADELVERFVSKGLMHRQYERVKLHATVMNTSFRQDATGVTEMARRGMKPRERESFDATRILRMFENYDFGMLQVSSIQLSQRHSTGQDGYYSCSAKIEL